MRILFVIALLSATAGLVPSSQAYPVPRTIQYQASLTDAEGDLFEGVVAVELSIHRTAEGGGAEYIELHPEVTVVSGILELPFGGGVPLFGQLPLILEDDYWLQVTIDGEPLVPRQRLRSVPAAQAAGWAESADFAQDATRFGGLYPEDFQRSLGNWCTAGSFLRRIFPDGSVECGADDIGTGDITEVNAGEGLFGGTAGGPAFLSVDFQAVQRRVAGTCGAGQYVTTIGSSGAVTCGTDANSGGDIQAVVVGNGLIGGGDSGPVIVAVANGGIATSLLADQSVTRDKIAAQAVGTEQLAAFSVGEGQIAGGAIDSAHIEPSSLTEGVLANQAVSTRVLAGDAVTDPKLASNAVQSRHIADEAIFAEHLHATVFDRIPRFGHTHVADTATVGSSPLEVGQVGVATPLPGVVHFEADLDATVNVRFTEDSVAFSCWLGTGTTDPQKVATWVASFRPEDQRRIHPRISTVVPVGGTGASGLQLYCITTGVDSSFVDDAVLTATFYPTLP